MNFSYHGHSVVQLETSNQTKIIIDPFINGNPLCDLKVESIEVDYIILTHAHEDHFGDTIEIAKNNDATVIAMVELCDYLESKNIKTHPMNVGGSHQFDFGLVKFFPALHSSSYQGKYMGPSVGVLIDDLKHTVYHAGDTALYSDMKLIGPVDLAFIPIGDNFTMGIDDAVLAAEWINATQVVPIHYDTFPLIKQDPSEFTQKLKKCNGIIPTIGKKFTLKEI